MSEITIMWADADREFGERLTSDLQANGVPVWREEFTTDRTLDGVLKSQFRVLDAGVYVLVMSPAMVEQPMDPIVETARRRATPDLLALHQTCEIPSILDDAERVDFRGDYDAAFGVLLARLRARPDTAS